MPTTLTSKKVSLTGLGVPRGTGWLPPIFDRRDYGPDHPAVAAANQRIAAQLKAHKLKAFAAPPSAIDLRPWCSPIEDQGALGSCSAHAAVGIVEYFERRAFGKHIDGSRLFIYKTTRNLLGVTGDTGAWLRNTMAALVMCGVPNERYWPYTDSATEFDNEPSEFVYAVADNFEATQYFAHDPIAAHVPPAAALASVKKYLAAGIPSMFGFWGFTSFDSGDAPGHIPLPTDVELGGDAEWGHAIVAVGYDNAKKITNTLDGRKTTGALLIRNSWSPSWGDHGYGWMPYDYLLRGAALDFWSLINLAWVDTDRFFD